MRGQPLTTTLRPEDHAFIVGLANALGRSVSSILEEIVHSHIVAEEQRLTSTHAAPTRKRK